MAACACRGWWPTSSTSGSSTQVFVELPGGTRIQGLSFHAGGSSDRVPAPGERVHVGWHPDDVRLVPAEREASS